jgi:uncharacterized protein
MHEISSRISKIHTLEVVLKTVERCNINCTYCYFFNDLDKSYLKHPKYISYETLLRMSEFLLKGVHDLEIENVVIILHGGEPLMQSKKQFESMCKLFYGTLGNITGLSINIQTNGLLVDNDWIELFERYNIGVGVSIDGPKLYNDQFRVDHKGRGTYDRLKGSLDSLFEAARNNRIAKPASLSVINPSFSASLIYHHLVHELGFSTLDFLLPDFTYITAPEQTADSIEKYLSGLFRSWISDDDPSIRIRLLDSVVKNLLNSAQKKQKVNQIISISTGGHVVPNDILRNTQFWDPTTEPSLFDNTLLDIVNSEIFTTCRQAELKIPQECARCCWKETCRGGELINRFSLEGQFDNPSLYCSALKNLYCDVAGHLLATGVSSDIISTSLHLT